MRVATTQMGQVSRTLPAPARAATRRDAPAPKSAGPAGGRGLRPAAAAAAAARLAARPSATSLRFWYR
jgi:pyruvate/2-oxoglutarate dehydrogenase complex dihydrolipoamide acyltransferase (E2) component